ncbi:hypothetical protein [Mesorhizobium sp. M0643]|uniref:hypothetical protein n=1 Tax=Mesorhizobium sp. M0643 TaxID=2956978 RepID=UPI003339AA2F
MRRDCDSGQRRQEMFAVHSSSSLVVDASHFYFVEVTFSFMLYALKKSATNVEIMRAPQSGGVFLHDRRKLLADALAQLLTDGKATESGHAP